MACSPSLQGGDQQVPWCKPLWKAGWAESPQATGRWTPLCSPPRPPPEGARLPAHFIWLPLAAGNIYCRSQVPLAACQRAVCTFNKGPYVWALTARGHCASAGSCPRGGPGAPSARRAGWASLPRQRTLPGDLPPGPPPSHTGPLLSCFIAGWQKGWLVNSVLNKESPL